MLKGISTRENYTDAKAVSLLTKAKGRIFLEKPPVAQPLKNS
jgi:hypothetical protein